MTRRRVLGFVGVPVLLALVLAFTLFLGSATPAAAISTYDSGFQIQNLGTVTATVTITFYNQDGTVAATVNDQIGANSSKTYYPLTSVSAGFNGSVVVSSDQPVAAIVNVLGDSGAFGASYSGFSSGSTTASIPLVMKNNYGFSTWFNVQNTGTADANVTVTYSNGTSEVATIKPGAAATFDQATNANLPDGFVGSAVVSSTQPVAIAVLEVGPTTLLAYNGFPSGSTELLMPLVNANNYGYVTGIQIQNLGTTDTDVTVSYTPSSAGSACTETQTVPAGKSATFALYAFTYDAPSGVTITTNCTKGSTFVGSAKVTANSANQPLVAIVNQLNSGANKGASYAAFDPAAGTSTVVFPLIMDRNFGYFTGFSVMNVGTSSTTVTCTFTGSSRTVNATLNPGEALTDVQLNQIADGYVGSAVCTASGGGSIVGVVNELNTSSTGDAFLVYEGANQ